MLWLLFVLLHHFFYILHQLCHITKGFSHSFHLESRLIVAWVFGSLHHLVWLILSSVDCCIRVACFESSLRCTYLIVLFSRRLIVVFASLDRIPTKLYITLHKLLLLPRPLVAFFFNSRLIVDLAAVVPINSSSFTRMDSNAHTNTRHMHLYQLQDCVQSPTKFWISPPVDCCVFELLMAVSGNNRRL